MQTIFKSQAKTIIRDLKNIILRIKQLDRETLASIYLSGVGIEIGALHNPLRVTSSMKVRYVDRMPISELRKQYPELKSYKLVNVDIVDDGETLKTVKDATQDFVVANHFLEHCENPINAVVNFVRVLRDGGVLYLSIPDKRYTFDRKRQVTSLDHHIHDYMNGPSLSRKEHFRDWVVNVEQKRDELEIQHRIEELNSANYSIHYHVWTQQDMFNFFAMLSKRMDLPIEIQLFFKNNEEAIFIIKKNSQNSL
jgi:predicted SAM-dependent methyltransferase